MHLFAAGADFGYCIFLAEEIHGRICQSSPKMTCPGASCW